MKTKELTKKERISKALKMFEKLGWKQLHVMPEYIELGKPYPNMKEKMAKWIALPDDSKVIMIGGAEQSLSYTTLTLDELKALNTMIFELGWYKDEKSSN